MSNIHMALTVKGQALNAKIQAGNGSIPLEITRVVSASGTCENPLELEDVIGQQQTAQIIRKDVIGVRAVLEIMLSNQGNSIIGEQPLTAGYSLSQFGMFAIDPDEGEILYRISQFDTPTYVPAAAEMGWATNPTWNFVVGNASEVIVTVDPSGMATKNDLNNHIDQAVVSNKGIHGLRFFEGALQAFNGTDYVNVGGNIAPAEIQQRLAQYRYAPQDAKVRAQANVDIQTGGLLLLDGYQLEDGYIVLLTEQTDARENGLYLAQESSWPRAPGYGPQDGQAFDRLYIPVESGTDAGKLYCIKTERYEIGSAELEFFEAAFSYAKIPGKKIIRDREGNFEGEGGGGSAGNRTEWERFISEFIITSSVGAPFSPVYADGPAHGKGNGAFSGGILMPNGKVVLAPGNGATIGIYDPTTNTLTVGPAHGKGMLAFFGGILLPNGKVLLVPYSSANIGLYDPATDTYSDGPAHGKGSNAFCGGVLLPDGKALLVPYSSPKIGIYDPANNTYKDGPAHGKGNGAFYGAAFAPNGKVILTPHQTPNIGIYDPATGTFSDGPAHGKTGNYIFQGAVSAPNGKIILVPSNSPYIGIYDPVADTYADGPAHGMGSIAFCGGVLLPNGKVLLVPKGANIGIYDPDANTYAAGPAHGKGSLAYYGGVLTPSGKVVLASASSANVGIVSTGLERSLSTLLSPFINKF